MNKQAIAATLYGQVEACWYTANGVLRQLDELENPYAQGAYRWEGVQRELQSAMEELDILRKEKDETPEGT